jgi:hypothetical protein
MHLEPGIAVADRPVVLWTSAILVYDSTPGRFRKLSRIFGLSRRALPTGHHELLIVGWGR